MRGTRMKTVLNPKAGKPDPRSGKIRPIRLSDYYSVPTISTYGTWQVMDMVSPLTASRLAALTNSLEKRSRSRAGVEALTTV